MDKIASLFHNLPETVNVRENDGDFTATFYFGGGDKAAEISYARGYGGCGISTYSVCFDKTRAALAVEYALAIECACKLHAAVSELLV